MATLYGKLLLLSLVAIVYGRPQENEIDNSLYVIDERCPPDESHHLLPHEYDCTKFYYCEYGLKHVLPRDCAPGTEFCFDHGVCIHASLANCPLPGPPSTECPGCPPVTTTTTEAPTTTTTTTPAPTTTTTTTTTTPAPTTTTTTPEPTTTTTTPEPTTTTTTTTTTPAPTTTTTTTTTTPEPTTPCDECVCPICPTTTESPSTTTAASTTTTQASTTTTTTTSTEAPTTTAVPCTECPPCPDLTTVAPTSSTPWVPTTTNPPSVTLPNGCPADFDFHHLLPHETECYLYYECIFGEKVERPCSPGTYFVFELQTCEHAELANCTLPGTSTLPPTISTSPTPWVPTTTNAPPVTLPNGCPADFGINYLLPHETECDRFYQCIYGQKIELSCAPGTHFVFELQACDHIATANCTLIGTTQPPCQECPSPTSTTTVGPNTTEAVTTTTTTTTTAAPTTTTTASTTTTQAPTTTTTAPTTTTTAPTTTTTTTTTTEVPITTAAPCPECPPCPDTTTTTTPEPTTTPAPCPDCPVCPICPPVEVPDPCETECHVPHWAHETDCDKFWRCEGNKKALGVCAEGLHFNVATQTCDFMCNANCIREEVQTTAERDGLKVFLPWEKVDNLVELSKYGEKSNINFGDLFYQMRI